MHLSKLSTYTYVENYNYNFLKKLPKKVSLIYRNYIKTDTTEIQKIHKYCRLNKRKFFISDNVKLAIKLKVNGVYIPSFNRNLNINFYRFNKKFEILGSAHTFKEIRCKEKQNVSKIFISPLFKNYKSDKYLGIHRMIYLKNFSKKKTICLGGIKKKNIRKLHLINPNGFAAISLFT